MRWVRWFRPPYHLLSLFLSITLLLAVGLVWLGWRILEQDRALESQRIQERLSQAANLASANLSRSFASLEQRVKALSDLPDPLLERQAPAEAQQLGSGAVVVVFGSQSATAYPPSQLLFYPDVQSPASVTSQSFAAAEALEFQQKNYSEAASRYRRLTNSSDTAVRAGAWLRLARVLRKANKPDSALAAYKRLAGFHSEAVAGIPAELMARAARCEVLDGLKRKGELEREAQALLLDLRHGQWKLTQASFGFYEREIGRWLGNAAPQSRDNAGIQSALALSSATESLWQDWQRIRQHETAPSGRRSLWAHGQSVFLLWKSTPERLVGVIAGPGYFEQIWRGSFEAFQQQGIRVTLTDGEGHAVLGPDLGHVGHQVTRTSADTGLPWILRVASTGPAEDMAQMASRRRLVLAGLGLLVLVVLAGGYFIGLAVTRELEVARVQSEFVSAVSHEFRTPLASLLQLSELLADGRISTDRQRQGYYESLLRETQRLSRLVESLLDFGRMEAGGREYHFETLNAGELVCRVAEEFGQEEAHRGYQIETSLDANLPPVRGDREALGRAVWNLLDNAVKYSPACKTVWAEARSQNGSVAIRVRDQGLGIAPEEQKQIFKKFVRAGSARVAGAKGTGLGLAMVEHIARAQGGRVFVESEPGAGSTFTILLPAVKG
jgi:signal transduction histidine kinase